MEIRASAGRLSPSWKMEHTISQSLQVLHHCGSKTIRCQTVAVCVLVGVDTMPVLFCFDVDMLFNFKLLIQLRGHIA